MRLRAVTFDDAAKARIARAASFEKRLRLEAAVGVDQRIGFFNLKQPTVRDILHLEYTENNLLLGKDPDLSDLVALVFILSTDRPFFKKRYARRVGEAIRECESIRLDLVAFFNSAFNDTPTSSNQSSVDSVDSADSSVSMMTLVDTIANSYGWSYSNILDMPVAVTLQLLQRISNRISSRYSIRNPITQTAKAKELERLKTNG